MCTNTVYYIGIFRTILDLWLLGVLCWSNAGLPLGQCSRAGGAGMFWGCYTGSKGFGKDQRGSPICRSSPLSQIFLVWHPFFVLYSDVPFDLHWLKRKNTTLCVLVVRKEVRRVNRNEGEDDSWSWLILAMTEKGKRTGGSASIYYCNKIGLLFLIL